MVLVRLFQPWEPSQTAGRRLDAATDDLPQAHTRRLGCRNLAPWPESTHGPPPRKSACMVQRTPIYQFMYLNTTPDAEKHEHSRTGWNKRLGPCKIGYRLPECVSTWAPGT